MKTHVEFRSDRFPPYPEEDEEVSPGIWGKRLAELKLWTKEEFMHPTAEPDNR